ncbi:MAG: hypothetical protein ACRD8O_16620 [Bryobacteraceae bacterium]
MPRSSINSCDLAPGQLAAVVSLLQVMTREPLVRKLAAAPIDDEPETADERKAIAEALDSLQRSGAVSMEVVLGDFGLTLEDFRRMAHQEQPEVKRS